MRKTNIVLEQYDRQNFWYTTGWSPAPMIAIGGVSNLQILISQDAPFLVYYVTAHVRQGAAGTEVLVLNWAGDIVWRDQSVGADLMNVAMPLDAMAGDGRDPYDLAPPRVFMNNTTVTFTATSNTAVRTEVNIVLAGAKLWPKG